MDQKDQLGFVMGCLIGFDMDSDDLDVMLQKYGLTLNGSTLLECQEALRDHVGKERWQNGIRAIRARTRDPKLN